MNASESIHTHVFPNGMSLVAEPMPWLESAAFSLLLPAGCIYDPARQLGRSNLMCEMAQRGCGSRDSRQFSDDLDRLGVERSGSVSVAHTSYGGAMLADNLRRTFPIYADLVRRPHLPADQLEDGREVCLQELRALHDDPAQMVMTELKRQFYGEPWGRRSLGVDDHVANLTIDDIRAGVTDTYCPGQAILAVAGNVRWPDLLDLVGQLWGDWDAQPTSSIPTHATGQSIMHIPYESNQTHIGVAYSSVPYADPAFFEARGAVGILSDGMSSRLFTEVRENRGLCYTVYAVSHSLRDRAAVLCYSATSNERAQETLDVLLEQLTLLAQGVHPDELTRLQARIKSNLILQQESSPSRSAAIAADWYHLGRVRPMDEIRHRIDRLNCQSINDFLDRHPPRNFTVVTLGAEPLEVRVGVS